MAQFVTIGGVPHIDLTGLKPGDGTRFDVKWPNGNFRRFFVQVSEVTPTRLAEIKVEHTDAATRATDKATMMTDAATDDQAVLDLVNDGDSIVR